MQNIAEFRIIGRVGKVDVKEKVSFIEIAANYNRKDNDGNWQTDTHWNRVTCFHTLAQRAARLEKGDLIHLTGRVRQTSWEKDGQRHYGVDLIAEKLGTIAKANGQGSDDNEGEE